MKKIGIMISAMALSISGMASDYLQNRAPLSPRPYLQLPIGNIKPEGWLKEQLQRQREGLTGHLDTIYSHVMGPRNGWLGGDGDMWERGPYWIDGLLPLAYILDDEGLKAKVQPWIEWALASQQSDGYFGPSKDLPPEAGLQRDNARDWWPKMVMLKVMRQYYDATGDERVIPFLTNYFKYQLENLPKTPLGHWTFWGERRGGDNLMVVLWLYNKTGDKFLLDLAKIIEEQTHDWTAEFLDNDVLSRQMSLHCVNLGQGFKEPIVAWQHDRDPRHLLAMEKAVNTIKNTIGLPTGLWGGDELLRFGKPTAGSELCTAAEMMFSLEEMLQITGDLSWADHLERVAYNALPTQVSDDYMTRQYYQMVNQVEVSRQWREFSTPHTDTDILFGTLTGYPCCTSNMHQAWPKLVQNLWYATPDHGLAALVYAPCNVTAKVSDGVVVNVLESTSYPFNGRIDMKVSFPDKKNKGTFFPFVFRVPAWCTDPIVMVNGEATSVNAAPGETIRLERTWKNGDNISLEFPMKVNVTRWYDGGAAVERGPLLYALKMNETWTNKQFEPELNGKYGDSYREVTSTSPWNFAIPMANIDKKNFETAFIVEEKPLTAVYPWNQEGSPITIHTKGKKVKNWKMVNGTVGPIAYYSQMTGDTEPEEEITLIPYGCTTLRIAEFPVRY